MKIIELEQISDYEFIVYTDEWSTTLDIRNLG